MYLTTIGVCVVDTKTTDVEITECFKIQVS